MSEDVNEREAIESDEEASLARFSEEERAEAFGRGAWLLTRDEAQPTRRFFQLVF